MGAINNYPQVGEDLCNIYLYFKFSDRQIDDANNNADYLW